MGALWLPVVAYAYSQPCFQENRLLMGSGDLHLKLIRSALCLLQRFSALAALVLRRPEQYRTYLRASAFAFIALVVLELLVIIVGQFSPNTISPAFSIVGSTNDLAFILGLGVIGVLFALREIELPLRTQRALIASGVGAVILLAIYNVSLVWILIALVSLGLFVESVMQRGNQGKDTDLDDVAVVDEEPFVVEEGSARLFSPSHSLAISLFFLIGGTLGGAFLQMHSTSMY